MYQASKNEHIPVDAAALSVVRRKAPSTIPTAAIATTAKNFIFGDVADLTNIQLETTTTTCCVIERKHAIIRMSKFAGTGASNVVQIENTGASNVVQ